MIGLSALYVFNSAYLKSTLLPACAISLCFRLPILTVHVGSFTLLSVSGVLATIVGKNMTTYQVLQNMLDMAKSHRIIEVKS